MIMYVLSVAISRITKYGALTDKQNMNSDMQCTDKLDDVKSKRISSNVIPFTP